MTVHNKVSDDVQAASTDRRVTGDSEAEMGLEGLSEEQAERVMADAKSGKKSKNPLAALGVHVADLKREFAAHAAHHDDVHDQAMIQLKPKEEEDTLLAELKTVPQVVECGLSDKVMLQCLRAKRYEVDKAVGSITRYTAWLKQHKVHSVDPQLVDEVFRAGTLCLTGGTDKEGRAIVLLRLRFHNPRKVDAEVMVAALHKMLMEYAYSIPEVQVRGFVLVHQLKGVGLRNVDPRVGARIIGALQGTLPVRMGAIYVCNASLVLRMLIKAVRSLVSPKMQARMHIVSKKSDLLKTFDADQLPEELGGSQSLDHVAIAESLSALKLDG